ncbi:Uncharacterized protein SCF082_LOCUS48780, partial [Durusdinium trenchii]
DRYNADSLLATGVVQVEQFCAGFDGMIPLSIAGGKGKRAKKQAMTLGDTIGFGAVAEAAEVEVVV